MYPAKITFITLIAVGYAASAHAHLGGKSASVETDRVFMQVEHVANQTRSSSGTYTMHETVLSTGTVVRQYVSNADVVFAVTWSGPFIPDLRQILGTHFDRLVAHQTEMAQSGRRFVSLHQADLVIESSGHQRSFFGRAYLPNEIPAGITIQDIQLLK